MAESAAKLIAIYRTPKSVDAFNRYYFGKHVAIARTIPGLRRYEVSEPVNTLGGDSPVHLIAILHFDDMASLQAALESDEGRATALDLTNFADGGVEILFGDTRDV